MSYVKENKYFFQLLLNSKTPFIQKRALLDSASKEQTLAIEEIIHNIASNNIPLTEINQEVVQKKKRIINALSQYKTSLSTKQSIIYKYSASLLELLEALKPQILEVIA